MTTEEIRLLLAKVHYGLGTREDTRLLTQLLEESEQVRRIHAEFKEVVATESFLTEDAIKDTWNRIEPRFEHDLSKAGKSRERRLWPWIAAACILIVVSISVLRWPNMEMPKGSEVNLPTLILPNGETIVLETGSEQQLDIKGMRITNNNREIRIELPAGDTENYGLNTLVVPKRLDFKITLPDSSVVWLNSASKFSFPTQFPAEERVVYLTSGEAFFNVTSNTKPFIVQTERCRIQVLGTAFNINSYNPDQIITSVLEGSVQVIDDETDTSVILKPSEQVTARENTGLAVQTVDVANTVEWRHGVHYFDNSSIEELATMFDRWFGVSLVIDNENVSQVRFRGRLDRKQPLESFIKAINLTGEATFYWESGVLHCR